MSKQTPAAEQFAKLGIDPVDYTPAMALAVKQKWTGLPVDTKVDELRAELAAVKIEPTSDADTLEAGGFGTRDECEAEAARLRRNAGVRVWRARNQIQAALDARDLRYRALRAKRQPAPAAVEAVS